MEKRLFFDGKNIHGLLSTEYVAWVDLMGTKAMMSRSLDIAANFILKLHVAALRASKGLDKVSLYPVMDGIYATAKNQNEILEFLRNLFGLVAHEFNMSNKNKMYQFIIKGSLAYGSVVHGRTIPDDASFDMKDNKTYRDAILLGMPMVQAYTTEEKAPPFGVFVHESARSFAPDGEKPFHCLWWRWGNNNDKTWKDLNKNLENYFSWCLERSKSIDYPEKSIEKHKKMFDQFSKIEQKCSLDKGLE